MTQNNESYPDLFNQYLRSPYKPGERSLADIEADLAISLPPQYLGEKRKGGQAMTIFTRWLTQQALKYYAPGWYGHEQLTISNERIACTYNLCIPTSDAGLVCRPASGDDSEDDDEMPDFSDDEAGREAAKKWRSEQGQRAFGSPTTRASGQAFKRAATQFSFQLHLRFKGKAPQTRSNQTTYNVPQASPTPQGYNPTSTHKNTSQGPTQASSEPIQSTPQPISVSDKPLPVIEDGTPAVWDNFLMLSAEMLSKIGCAVTLVDDINQLIWDLLHNEGAAYSRQHIRVYYTALGRLKTSGDAVKYRTDLQRALGKTKSLEGLEV